MDEKHNTPALGQQGVTEQHKDTDFMVNTQTINDLTLLKSALLEQDIQENIRQIEESEK